MHFYIFFELFPTLGHHEFVGPDIFFLTSANSWAIFAITGCDFSLGGLKEFSKGRGRIPILPPPKAITESTDFEQI